VVCRWAVGWGGVVGGGWEEREGDFGVRYF